MNRYVTTKEFYKIVATLTFVVIGSVGIIIFYPITKLSMHVANSSIILGATWGAILGWMVRAGEQDRGFNNVDMVKLLIFAILSAPSYLGIIYLVTKFNETYDVILLAGFSALAMAGTYLFIWCMKHG